MHPHEMNGDWRDLWTQYAPRLLLFARQQTPRLSEAEDIVQDAFVRYWRAQQADPSLSPDLLFAMVRRIAIDYARKNRARCARESQADGLPGPADIWFVDPVEERERKEEIEKALRALVVRATRGPRAQDLGRTHFRTNRQNARHFTAYCRLPLPVWPGPIETTVVCHTEHCPWRACLPLPTQQPHLERAGRTAACAASEAQ